MTIADCLLGNWSCLNGLFWAYTILLQEHVEIGQMAKELNMLGVEPQVVQPIMASS